MTKSSKPVKNSDKGQENSRKVRHKALVERDPTIWGHIVGASLVEGLNTYQQFADDLNNRGYKTSRGNKWTAQSVYDVFKRHQTTAKKLKAALDQPSPYEREKQFKPDVFKKMVKSVSSIIELCEKNGEWRSGLEVQPNQGDNVRHKKYGEGFFFEQKSLGKYKCKFFKEGTDLNKDRLEENIIEVILPASEVEIFKFELNNQKRVDKGKYNLGRFQNNKDNYSDPPLDLD
tara:strand:+ start:12355 stop:13047 length:693 start_codon:yes stop_codon:yes gene_type:complete